MTEPRRSRRTVPGIPALAASLSLLLGGCAALPAIGPDCRTPALALPAAWTAAPAPPVADGELAEWWRQLADPTLDRLIGRALSGNLDLRAAAAHLRQARAARAQAVAGYFPSIAAALGASRTQTPSALGSARSGTLYDAAFDASWEIDLFGGTRRGVEAAGADLAASRASAAATRVSLVGEVAVNYIELRAYQQRLAIARANLASQDETLRIAGWREQAGLVGHGDVVQAQTNREQTRATLPDLEIGAAAAENRLAGLLGLAPGALHAELAAAQPVPAVGPGLAAGIPAAILTRRPDLIAAERTLAAETARLGQAQARRFPSLTLAGSFGWQAYRLAALGGSAALARAASGALAATLFDGGALRAAQDKQDAVRDEALANYEQAVLGALEEVENALFAHARAHERLAARQAAAQAARQAATLNRRLYEAGLSDFQKVLDSQRTQLAAEDAQASAEATLTTTLVQLYKALGGGWPAAASEDDA